ncbi:MAG: ferredoxin reductase family protein [Anaerosomatales bacterium]|nr:ferredoxin reductase family protein [Anaerosomatales bacterium]MDT8434039.1 ferredoxin reductase family protein [Anaerosomatales bacterium]
MRLIIRGVFWFGIYLTIILLPLIVGVVFIGSQQSASPLVHLAIASGYIALALMATELALVSRFGGVAGAFGLDSLLQFHRQIGIASMVFAIAHPVLLLFDRAYSPLYFISSAGTPWPVTVGVVAFAIAVLVVGLSVYRRQLRISYGVWHLTHGLFSIALIGFAAAHVLGIGRFAALPVMRVVWILYLLFFVGMFLRYRFFRPLSLLHRPWEIVENRAEHGQSHTLVLRPVGHEGFRFEPGQFAWIGFGRSPFAADQHPISFSSNGDIPSHDGTIAFTIKRLGDWSRDVVPHVEPGTRAWVDGPHGVFTIDREEGAGYCLIGGGVGITPLYAMLQALETRDDPRPVFMFHAANEYDDLTFREELAEMAGRIPTLTLVTVLLNPPEGWDGETGFVTADMLSRYLPPTLYRRFQYFICGPGPLMDAMEKTLPAIGVPRDRVHTERFDMV